MSTKSLAPKPKVLVILGTTSAGKTKLAVRLAAEFKGEIVSADSRQVYQGLDVGSGKDLSEYRFGRRHIPYHLIDVVSPKSKFNVVRYQKLARRALGDILKRGKLPIVVGGSGLYLQALIDNYDFPSAARSAKLQKIYGAWPAEKLYQKIRRLQPEFAARLNNSDRHNPRRLLRYLEIVSAGVNRGAKQESPYDFLLLGLDCSDKILKKRIRERLLRRLAKEGLVAEVENLRLSGLSWRRLEAFGLEYKFVSQYLQGQLSYQVMVERLDAAIYRFAKRQKTWFKRWEKQGRKIKWIKGLAGARAALKKWL